MQKGTGLNRYFLEDCSEVGSLVECLTTEQAAAYLGITKASLLNMVHRGRVPHRKFGRLNYYKLSELIGIISSIKRGIKYDS